MADKPFSDMTMDELIAERAKWDDKIRNATAWGASLAVAETFRRNCDREIERRKRAQPVPGVYSPTQGQGASRADKHNELAREFVMKAGRETRSAEELMVVIESAICASMILLTKLYDFSPAKSNEMVESAVHRATERFAALDGGHARG